jgi:hypothetical protein
MEFWNNIIHSAMMGTDKKTIGPHELPADLAEAAALVSEKISTDKEERFLQLATLAWSYRQCGVLPLKKETIIPSPGPAEEKPYCSSEAMQALKNILDEEIISLVKFWLQHCASKKQIVQPELLPTLLSLGLQHKNLQPLVTDCCGKRGEWLARFNEAWNFSSNQSVKERWQNGTPEKRKSVLSEMRSSDPATALEWLQETWAQEDANTKTSLLEILAENIGNADIPFLESLSVEKSKKVRDQAINLLKQIPGSPVVNQYEECLRKNIQLKKQKALLGLSSKMTLHFESPAIVDENIFKTGVEKLSSSKEFTDDEYIIYQVIKWMPPVFWEQHLNDSFENIIAHFEKDLPGKKMVEALVHAIGIYKDQERAIKLLRHAKTVYVDLLLMLPPQEQNYFSIKFVDESPELVISHAIQFKTEWTMELTRKLFKHFGKMWMHYPKSFFNQVIHLVPAGIKPELAQFGPGEDAHKIHWTNITDHLSGLLQLKQQTIQAFNA